MATRANSKQTDVRKSEGHDDFERATSKGWSVDASIGRRSKIARWSVTRVSVNSEERTYELGPLNDEQGSSLR